MSEKDPNLSSKKANIESPIREFEIKDFGEKKNSNNASSDYIRKETHKIIPFEYCSVYGYLYTRLKWILDNNETNGQFRSEMYSLLETIGELRVLGVFNEPYKKYRRALDTFSLKLDSDNEYNENTIDHLRYQCYQSSASGRKELKIIDRGIKEWIKRDRENKLLHSYRGAMSEWLNKSELRLNKTESKTSIKENIFKNIIDSPKDLNNPLQQSQMLSFLSQSYISEKILPFMIGQATNNSSDGALSSEIFGETIKSETPNPGASLSSIELSAEDTVDEDLAILVEERSSPSRADYAPQIIQKNNESPLNNLKKQKNESVMNWIRTSFNRKQDNYFEKSELINDNDICKEKINQSLEREKILSLRLSRKLYDISKDISAPSLLNKNFIIKEYFEDHFSIYKIFTSMRDSVYKKRKYYKTIPTIGSARFKKQEIELDEVRKRQFQSIYNDGILSEPINKIRRVMLYRSEWKRPPMYLLITHKGRRCKGNFPLAREENINYDIDTDEEWEEQFGGEDVENIDDLPDIYDEDDDNDAVASGWLVPDGYFQSDELMDELTVENSNNFHNANIVNLFPPSSQFPSPVVISFLNHTSIDFGVGISIPNEVYVNSILKSYLINFTQNTSWIYNKTDLSRNNLLILTDEPNCQFSSSIPEAFNTRKSALDLQLKQELSYFIHGKWASIRSIIDEFFEINNYKDIKKTTIINFIKENVRKSKLAGDVRFRWYVDENNTNLELDSRKLSELLVQRKAEEKNTSNKIKQTKTGQNRTCQQICTTSPTLISQVRTSENSCSNRKGKQQYLYQNIDIDPEYSFNQKITADNDENNNINSQYSMRSNEGVSNIISSSQESEQFSANSQTIEKEVHSETTQNSKKRKFSTPIRNTPNVHSECSSFDRVRNGDGMDGNEGIKLNTPESKKRYAHLCNNSLITQFFPPKTKN